MAVGSNSILLDSNVLIGILNGSESPQESLEPNSTYCISVVSAMELFALSGMSAQEENRIWTLVSHLEVLPATLPIAVLAGQLARTRRRGKPDLIIAATAIVHRLPLLTRNVKDFRSIPRLSLHTA